MVATEVVMPKMGYDMTEGTILKWRKQEGEAVRRGEILAEIETTKVTVEVEAYASGILRKILTPEGQTVPVGEAIAIIAAPDEADAAETAPSRKQAPRTQAAAPAAAHRETPAPPTAPPKEGRTSASPLARKVARELSVEVAQVRGTGPGGRIIREDVERFAETATPAKVTAVPRLGAEARPLTRIRQTIARRMTESKQQAPHFYVTVDIDMGEALALRRTLNAARGEQGKVSVTDMLVKAAALALVEFPDMNASYAGETVQMHDRVNIGVAVAREEGLITPVIPDCHLKTLTEIAREARGMIERARVGKM
ncbi:MAG: dihydrolipoamide acetyltransferase family protein, partial [Candidatus Methylomirabilales bacterium]